MKLSVLVGNCTGFKYACARLLADVRGMNYIGGNQLCFIVRGKCGVNALQCSSRDALSPLRRGADWHPNSITIPRRIATIVAMATAIVITAAATSRVSEASGRKSLIMK